MKEEHAALLTSLIEHLSSGQYQASGMMGTFLGEMGYKPDEVVEAMNALSEAAGQGPCAEIDDFHWLD